MSPNPTVSSSHGGSAYSLPNKLTEQFEMLGEVSRGGMGVVYKARDRQLGRLVAIKVITGPKELTDVMRFQREAQVLAQIQHKNVARIWDFGWHNQSPFLVMEYLEGPTLAEVVREHLRTQGACPNPLDIAKIMASLAEALVVCHSQGIVHRDLKPENIILAKGPSNEDRVVLLDFGVAKKDPTMGPTGRSVMLTATGELLGTPAFMAPEQFSPNSDFGPIGLATDIWGFGATLFFCLTGEYPYSISNGSIGIFEAMMDRGPRRVQSLNLSIPPWLDLLCAACLRRATKNRPDMKALVWQLKRQLDQEEMKSASGVSLFDSQWHDRETLPRSSQKHWWLLFLLLLLLPPAVMAWAMTNKKPPVAKDNSAALRSLRERLNNNLEARKNDLESGRTLNLRKALALEAKILKLEESALSTETSELFALLRLLQAEEAYMSGDFNVAKQHLASAKRKDSKQHTQWLLLSGLVASKDPTLSDAETIKLLRAGNAENSAREEVTSALRNSTRPSKFSSVLMAQRSATLNTGSKSPPSSQTIWMSFDSLVFTGGMPS
ncbi:MAG: serine/threonine-protein kinase [Planctomycetota bacterium]|nr:serine/threonine-protein kinase [Planctomycetota bacterium]